MAFNNSFTAVVGATYTAAQYNTHVRDNFTAIWVYTTAGDIVYASSATTLARLALVAGGVMYGGASAPAWLALGAAHTFLKSAGGSAPLYGALVYRRKGGNSTDWEATGSTTYSPTATLIQIVAVQVSYSVTGTQVITYPETFSQRPAVFISANNTSSDFTISYSDASTSGCTVRVRNVTGGSGTVDIMVLAIGA